MWDPAHFVVDFEKAEHAAIRLVFPHAGLHGCLFHLGQNILKHSKTLANLHSDAEGRILVQTLKGLPFLPIEDIQYGWDELKVLFSVHFGTSSDIFIKYFEETYLERGPRSYKVELWNCSQRHHDNVPQTNNFSEASNLLLKGAFGFAKPFIWTCVEKLCEVQAQTDIRITHLSMGISPDPPRDKKWINRD